MRRIEIDSGGAHGAAGDLWWRPILTATLVVGLGALGSACSSKGGGADTAGPTTPTTATPTTSGPTAEADAAANEDVTPAEVSPAADEVVADAEADPLTQKLQAVAALEIPGMTKNRAQVMGELVTLQLDGTANAKGVAPAVEVTVSACSGCVTPTVEEVEGRRDMLMQQLGELHAKNPALVFEVKPLELAPARSGTKVYARSFIDDGTTRASVHTLEVHYADNGFMMRFQAYPRGGAFPSSAEELAGALTGAELEAAVQVVFVAVANVLWPPATP